MTPGCVTGASWTGSGIPCAGGVVQVDAVGLDFGVVLVSWVAVAPARRWAVYVDSVLRTVTSGTSVPLAGLSDGDHDVAVVPLADHDTAPEIRPEWATGDQALLTWTRVPDAHGYRVDFGGQDVTVTERAADVGIRVGVLGGRVRFAGTPVQDSPPDILTVEIGAGGRSVTWSGTSTLEGSGIVGRGLIVALPHGLTMEFLDDPASYQEGETFTLSSGPVTRWLSDAMGRGAVSGGVAAVDGYGLESDPAEVSVFVPNPDAEVVEWSTAWDEDEDVLATTWEIGGDHATGVRVFSNLPSVGGLLPDVDERCATWSASGTDGVFLWPRIKDSWAGDLLMVVEIETSTGQWVREGIVRRVRLPLGAPALGTAEMAEAAQRGLGVDAVAEYRSVSGDVLTAVRLSWRVNGGTATTQDIATAPPDAGFGVRIVGRLEVPLAENGDVVTVTARGVGAGGLLGAESAALSVELAVVDPDAPTAAAGTPA